MTMLSRVAENVYWMARYLERAEDTSRLVNVTTHLVLDLPKKIAFDWETLVDITGYSELFRDHYGVADERNLVGFLVGDTLNPGSVIYSLNNARENARTIRDIIPREAWEQINNLYLKCKGNLQSGLSRRGRYDYLHWTILGVQTITGMLAGTMTHDAGYGFLRMGRNLERADMTTRIIDVRSVNLLAEKLTDLLPFENIQWMSVLKSLTGYQMYRRAMQVRVRRPDVLKFLFQDRRFPRSFYHAISEVEGSLRDLPRNDAPLRLITKLQRVVSDAEPERLSQTELHQFIDELQAQLAEIHDQITTGYFLAPVSTAR
jgi:uncharacterized alpha-E superfamily protein